VDGPRAQAGAQLGPLSADPRMQREQVARGREGVEEASFAGRMAFRVPAGDLDEIVYRRA
jgi:hypothetical protein